VTALIVATIWLALVLFAVGEYGKRHLRERGTAPPGFWWAGAVGLAIGVLHVVIALARDHDWSHATAWRVTEMRAREIFGFGWGGFVLVNYLFLAAWGFELWRWRRDPDRYRQQPAPARTAFRIFSLVMILNGGVVFASGPRRGLGFALVVALLWIWRPLVSSSRVGAHALGRCGD
jgi:hypothetical protein